MRRLPGAQLKFSASADAAKIENSCEQAADEIGEHATAAPGSGGAIIRLF
jgi:hypothetical protein